MGTFEIVWSVLLGALAGELLILAVMVPPVARLRERLAWRYWFRPRRDPRRR